MDLFEAHGAQFIAADDMIVAWIRREGREFEPETWRWTETVLDGRAGAIVDVGASTGWYAIPWALAGRDVLAIEPDRAVVDRLAANVAANGAPPVLVRNVAASRSCGLARFWRNPAVPLTSGGSIETPTCRRPVVCEVETVRVDEAAAEAFGGGAVALIKVDVEGHEVAVLDGARALIERDRPFLVLEANTPAHRASLEQWLEVLGGYEIAVADSRNLLCAPQAS